MNHKMCNLTKALTAIVFTHTEYRLMSIHIVTEISTEAKILAASIYLERKLVQTQSLCLLSPKIQPPKYMKDELRNYFQYQRTEEATF